MSYMKFRRRTVLMGERLEMEEDEEILVATPIANSNGVEPYQLVIYSCYPTYYGRK